MQATKADLELFSHIQDEKRRTYCAMVHRLDINVGRIMKTLEEEGLSENTVIVFISDNGGPCDQNASVNAPLNGQKGILLEGGIRVPFIMKWTGQIPSGKTFEHPVISLDLAPTFIELAGGKISEYDKLDGVNLIPFITGKTKERPHELFNWRFTISAVVREGDWKLVRLPDRLPMLFNLTKDISEQNNVALQNPERTKTMLKQLGLWDVSLPHPVFLEGAVWKKQQLDLYDKKYKLVQPE
jgi:arylsulfatase A-like enzyme